LHFNKGLAGASQEVLARCRETSVNPVAYEAAALAILAAGTVETPDPKVGAERAARVTRATDILKSATPDSGAYANEADFFEPDWQRSFWGPHYPRLLEIKRRYDPAGLFHCHHSVGSEGWSLDGMTRS
jgi:hypothetical protein